MAFIAMSNINIMSANVSNALLSPVDVDAIKYNPSRFGFKNGKFTYKNPTSGNTHPVNNRFAKKHLLSAATQNLFKEQIFQAVDAKNILSLKPKPSALLVIQSKLSIAQNIAASKARKVSQQGYKLSHANVLSSFENEGGRVLGAAVKASKFAINPKMVAAGLVGSTIAGAGAYAYNKYRQPTTVEQIVTEQTSVEKHVANSVMADIAKNKTTAQATKFERVANAFNDARSFVTSNITNHPRIATGAGLATVAGLSVLAYKKGLFGKAAIQLGLKKETKRK